MIIKEIIDRINALSQKQRQYGLNEDEKTEQALLRRQYLDNIKEQVRGQIAAAQISKTHPVSCACGCHGPHRH